MPGATQRLEGVEDGGLAPPSVWRAYRRGEGSWCHPAFGGGRARGGAPGSTQRLGEVEGGGGEGAWCCSRFLLYWLS